MSPGMFPAAGVRPHGRNTAATRYPPAASGTWGLTFPPPPPSAQSAAPELAARPTLGHQEPQCQSSGNAPFNPQWVPPRPEARPEARPAATAWSASRRAPTAAARPPRPGTSRGRPCAAAPWRRAARRPCPPGCAVETGHPPQTPRPQTRPGPGICSDPGQAPVGSCSALCPAHHGL